MIGVRRVVSVAFLPALLLLVVSTAHAIDLGTLPGLTSPQARVGTAIDIVCPQLGEMAHSLNSTQTDLLRQCTNMKDGSLGTVALPGVLSNVTTDQTTTQGNSVIDTRTPQFVSLGARLLGLRLGTAGVKVGDLKLDDGSEKALAGLFGLDGEGGGASADSTLGGKLGLFFNPIGSFGNQDATSREAGYDFHNIGVLAGADYRIADNLFAGAAFTYLRTDADINAPALGSVDSNGYGLSLYGTYYTGPLYFDLLGGFTYYNYDISRQISYGPGPGGNPNVASVNRTASATTTGWQYSFNGGTGYDFSAGPFVATPYFRVDYLHLAVAGYTESGADGLNLKVKSQTVESLLTVLGGRLSYAFSTPFGVLVPQVRGEWRHENLGGQYSIQAQFAADPTNTIFSVPTDTADRNYFAVGAGLSALLAKGVSAFVDFETILGLQNVTNYGFTGGIRVSF
jgi:outer membrane autotransporter protein